MRKPTQYEPLDPEACRVLAVALGDAPETVHTLHTLRRGTCRAYVAGDPARFDGAIVQPVHWPTEPTGFGSAPAVLWDLLQSVKGWECVLVDSECASPLGKIIKKETGLRARYLEEICYTLNRPVKAFENESVRRLNLADLDLLASAPVALRASLWTNLRELLIEGIVACAVISDRIVATALTTACTDRYADVGVYTREGFRCRGYATAAASLVAREVQEGERVPVWGVGEHNVASRRIAEKLGFVEVSRRRYVILPRNSGTGTRYQRQQPTPRLISLPVGRGKRSTARPSSAPAGVQAQRPSLGSSVKATRARSATDRPPATGSPVSPAAPSQSVPTA
jgi:RimJ/RimL family protein N-acetyltransferase